MKWFLIVCLALSILVLVVLALYLIIGDILFTSLFGKRGKIRKKNKSSSTEKEFLENYKKIECTNEEQLKLCGFYKDNGCGKLAIILHGLGNSHEDMVRQAKIFTARNFDILLLDMRSHGQSGGKFTTFGYSEGGDLLLWINQMLSLKEQYKIVLFGLGIGASAICNLFKERVPNNVVAAILDSSFDNLSKEIKFLFSKYKLFGKMFYSILNNYSKKTEGIDIEKINNCQNLKMCKIPILFFHGEKDDVVPLEMMFNLSSQIPEMRRFVYIGEGASHEKSIDDHEKEYVDNINRFLIRYSL